MKNTTKLTNQPHKVLLVITGLGMGGAEHVVVNLANALIARGHQVKIAYLTGEALVLPQSLEVEVISIGMSSSKDVLKAYVKLRALIKKMQPDVIHSHMFHSNLLARLIRLSINVPKIISSSHNTNEGGKLRMLAYRFTDKLADISTNVSQEAVDTFVQKGIVKPDRMITVANGINTHQFYLDEYARITKREELNITDKKVLLAVGRLDNQKDYPNLLNAIASLKEMRQDFIVLIVGDGPLREEMTSLAESLGVADLVKFLGIRRDIQALMSAADFYVMSSAWEGLPMVILEAMACERVVVATDCGGVKEVVGSKGFLVEPRNSGLLAIELNKALDLSVAERSTLGSAARQRIIDNYSLEANVEAYLELYNA